MVTHQQSTQRCVQNTNNTDSLGKTDLIYWPCNQDIRASEALSENPTWCDRIPLLEQLDCDIPMSSPVYDSTTYIIGWKDDNSGKETVVLGMYHHTSIETIIETLQILKEKYPCEKLKQSTNRLNEALCNSCMTCICIQHITIVAKLQTYSDQSSSTEDSQIFIGKQTADIPTFYLYPNNPTQKGIDIMMNEPSLSSPYLIFYPLFPYNADRPRSSLGHFRTDLIKVSIKPHSAGNRLVEEAFSHSSHTCTIDAFNILEFSMLNTEIFDSRWRRILLRISEVSTITRELKLVGNEQSRSRQSVVHTRNTHNLNHEPPNKSSSSDSMIPLLLSDYFLVVHVICSRYQYHSTKWIGSFVSMSPLLTTFSRYWNQNHLPSIKVESYVPREVRSILFHYKDNECILQLLDGLLGFLFGCFLLLYCKASVVSLLTRFWTLVHFQLLRGNLSWLESYPIGFKLNPPLTSFFGQVILFILDSYDYMLQSFSELLNIVQYIKILCILSIFGGFNVTLALIYDSICLFTLHIYFLYAMFQFLYHHEIILISSLTNLFRGRKKNVLRHRFDTIRSDYMQLIVMMIIFAICLFLYTTFLVYYVFFTLIYLFIKSLQIICCSTIAAFNYCPFGLIVARCFSPDRFLESVHVIKVSNYRMGGNNSCVLAASPRNVSSIISSLISNNIVRFVQLVPRLLIEVLLGQSLSLTCNLFSFSRSSLSHGQQRL